MWLRENSPPSTAFDWHDRTAPVRLRSLNWMTKSVSLEIYGMSTKVLWKRWKKKKLWERHLNWTRRSISKRAATFERSATYHRQWGKGVSEIRFSMLFACCQAQNTKIPILAMPSPLSNKKPTLNLPGVISQLPRHKQAAGAGRVGWV